MATYYVDANNGSDEADGLAATSGSGHGPWKTLHRAIDGEPTRETGGSNTASYPYLTKMVAGDTVYLLSGTYEDIQSIANVGQTPVYNMTTLSGSSGSPTTVSAHTGHTPILKRKFRGTSSGLAGDGDHAHAVIGGGANTAYINLTGLTVKDGQIHFSGVFVNNCIVSSCTVNRDPTLYSGDSAGTPGNFSCIHFEQTSSGAGSNNTVYNCTAYGAYWPSLPGDNNPAGIKQYRNTSFHVYNNYVYDCNIGIDDKDTGISNIYELNFIRDCSSYGFRLNSQGVPATPPHDVTVRYNVIVGGGGILCNCNSGMYNLQVYNNTYVGLKATRASAVPGDGIFADNGNFPWDTVSFPQFYNNILVQATTATAGAIHYHLQYSSQNQPPLSANGAIIDYNCYYGINNATSAMTLMFRCRAGDVNFTNWGVSGTPSPSTNWRGIQSRTDIDPGSLNADPLFAGTPSLTAAIATYDLLAGSTCRGAGRTGGTSAGSAVHMGAFYANSITVGLTSGSSIVGVWLVA